jgi:hypothetical protein
MTRRLSGEKTHTLQTSLCSVGEFPFSGHSLSARQIFGHPYITSKFADKRRHCSANYLLQLLQILQHNPFFHRPVRVTQVLPRTMHINTTHRCAPCTCTRILKNVSSSGLVCDGGQGLQVPVRDHALTYACRLKSFILPDTEEGDLDETYALTSAAPAPFFFL